MWPPRGMPRRPPEDACATKTGKTDELACGESCGDSGAVALRDGLEALGVDGDVGLGVEVAFDDGDEEVQREALVGGGDEPGAAVGGFLQVVDVLERVGVVEPTGERADADLEPARDLLEGLVGIDIRGEDVVGGLFGGVEGERGGTE